MALTPAEKELLAVVSYYNSQPKQIAKLVRKMYSQMEFQHVKQATGFTGEQIFHLLKFKKEPKLPKKVLKNPPKLGVKNVIEFDQSRLAGRIAQELYEQWETRFKSGDYFLKQSSVRTEWGCTYEIATQVFKLLREQGLIEFVDPTNVRRGYVVK